MSPMLLHKSMKPRNDEDYLTELKLDGVRLLLSKHDDKIRLYTRHRNEITANFPELQDIDIPNGTILDGELIVPGEGGKPDFESMMERFQSRKSPYFVQFCVFDVPHYNGKKLYSVPLIERKEILDRAFVPTQHIVKSQYVVGMGAPYFELVKEQGLEGIVQKKTNSYYHPGKRSYDWLKVINYQYSSCMILGFRKKEFGLLLGFPNGDYAGVMEFFPADEKRRLYIQKKVVKETADYEYIEPIPVEVKYRNLTKTGLLRIPSFNGWAS